MENEMDFSLSGFFSSFAEIPQKAQEDPVLYTILFYLLSVWMVQACRKELDIKTILWAVFWPIVLPALAIYKPLSYSLHTLRWMKSIHPTQVYESKDRNLDLIVELYKSLPETPMMVRARRKGVGVFVDTLENFKKSHHHKNMPCFYADLRDFYPPRTPDTEFSTRIASRHAGKSEPNVEREEKPSDLIEKPGIIVDNYGVVITERHNHNTLNHIDLCEAGGTQAPRAYYRKHRAGEPNYTKDLIYLFYKDRGFRKLHGENFEVISIGEMNSIYWSIEEAENHVASNSAWLKVYQNTAYRYLQQIKEQGLL